MEPCPVGNLGQVVVDDKEERNHRKEARGHDPDPCPEIANVDKKRNEAEIRNNE